MCCSSAADVERFLQHMMDEDEETKIFFLNFFFSFFNLQPMMDEDEETRMAARGLNIPLDGDGGRFNT